MDVGGIFSKVESNADKIGALVGALSAVHSHAWGKDIPNGIKIILQQLIADPHIPNLAHVWEAVTKSEFFTPSLIAMVGGYALETVDLDKRLERLGSAFKKAGFGAMIAGVATNVLIYSGAGHSETFGANHSLGGGSHFNFLGGSRHNPHGAYSEPSIAPLGTNLTRSGPSSPSPYA